MGKQYRPRLSQAEMDVLLAHRGDSDNILIIGDTHLPFTHVDYRDFCTEVAERFGCSRFVHIGDLVDNHAFSYHEHDPNGMGPVDELEAAQEEVDKWVKRFPNVKMCLGNHDELIARKAKTHGLPQRLFKSFPEIWNLPDTWEVAFKHEIDGVLYTHGTKNSGYYAHINLALANMQSTVIGHVHSYGGVNYRASQKDLIFGMNVGCGIDVDMYAMEYGRDFKHKPTLGCGVVMDGGKTAMFVPMDLK